MSNGCVDPHDGLDLTTDQLDDFASLLWAIRAEVEPCASSNLLDALALEINTIADLVTLRTSPDLETAQRYGRHDVTPD